MSQMPYYCNMNLFELYDFPLKVNIPKSRYLGTYTFLKNCGIMPQQRTNAI